MKNQKEQIAQRMRGGRIWLKTILQPVITRRSISWWTRFLLFTDRYYVRALLLGMLISGPGLVFGQATRQLTLLFAGDIMGHDTQIEAARLMGGGTYDYNSCFRYVEPYIAAADIAIGNLEVTLAGPPYKGYPRFSSPDALADALKNAGFDILVQANNHAVDRGKAGLERTLKVLDSIGMVRSGVFRDNQERMKRYPLIVEKNGIRLALLNYSYSTNGIRVTPPNIVNNIDTVTIREDLQKAATADPDFTIALMHWGSEYQLTENSEQQRLARFLFRNGADAIIGSHPHVVQPIREIDGKLVVYSLGNMISNQRKRYTDGGILFGMTLEKNDSVRLDGTKLDGTRFDINRKVVNRIPGTRKASTNIAAAKLDGSKRTGTRVTGYHYVPVWVHKPRTDQGATFSLVPAAIDSVFWKEMNITTVDAESMLLFLEDTRKNLKGVIELEPQPR